MKLDKATLGNTPFLTDGGLETELIFHYGIDLPHFAAFQLLNQPKYHELIRNYYRSYMEIARTTGTGFILESPTWRASKDWGYKLGYTEKDLEEVNTLAIDKLKALRASYKDSIDQMFISGCIGPRGDGYAADEAMTAEEATLYHHDQIATYSRSEVDLVTAMTMNYSNEALGVVKAAMQNDCHVVISFTVETDGHLPNGESLKEAITRIDHETGSYPLYYMINCAHPTHFVHRLEQREDWILRIRGLRANASDKCHAELDEATVIDRGNPELLGNWYGKLKDLLPELFVYGGCCGTDAEHVMEMLKGVTSQQEA